MIDYEYQVGGSLKIDAPSYVVRQVDSELYAALKAGDFCYVLSSRQMGKSSVRVRMKYLLEQEGFSCASIDLSRIGSDETTPERWYKGIVSELIRCFQLNRKINLKKWWSEREEFSIVQRLGLFIEDVLLVEVKSDKIFVFIDEIDSVLSLNFPIDDFFALIRSCYNHRTENAEYNRLTFALFGVATPSDLIQDKNRTPFNIGKAIELQGFKIQEAMPLAKGLAKETNHPEQVLAEILNWTGGQPFLTQKLCKLVVEGSLITFEDELPIQEVNVSELVRTHLIQNWEANDEPEHLRTIRDRILSNEQRASRLLSIYQEILETGFILADDSSEQIDLLLSGLVIRQEGRLKVKNKIYQEVFNLDWIKKQLETLRPYFKQLEAWIASNRQDESRLLRGKALQDAQNWVASHSLSDLDYQFLAASQESEKRQVELTLEAQREAARILEDANQTLIQAQKKAKKTILISQWIAAGLLGLASFLALQAFSQQQRATISEIQTRTLTAEELLANHQPFDGLIAAMLAAQKLKELSIFRHYPAVEQQVIVGLQSAVNWIIERDRLEQHNAQVNTVHFAPDGQLLATGSADTTAKIWQRDNSGKLQLISLLTGHSAPINQVRFSPDGKLLATASADQTVKLWSQDSKTGKFQLLATLNHDLSVNGISFSPDRQFLATASADKTVKIWRVRAKKTILQSTLTGHQSAVNGVSFSPDGKLLVTASADYTSQVWDVAAKPPILLQTLRGHQKEVNKVQFSSDSQLFATVGADKQVILWEKGESNSFKRLETLTGHNASVNAVQWSPDRQILATASLDKTVKLWQRNGQLLLTLTGHGKEVQDVSFTPDGTVMASASGDRTVKFWQLQGQKSYIFPGHQAGVHRLSFSPDGKWLATASRDQTIKLWQLGEKGGIFPSRYTLDGQNGEVYSVNFSPNGKELVATCGEGTVKFWNFQNFIKNCISPRLCSSGSQTLKGHKGEVYSSSFSPDGKWLATASADKTVKLWNLSAKVPVVQRSLTGHELWVFAVQFSPDGKKIATASADNSVKLWRLDHPSPVTLTGHKNWVYAVSFSSDNQKLATASGDKTVKVWDISGQTPTLLETLTGHEGEVYGVSFSPDHQQLASASEDKTVKLWQWDGKKYRLRTTLKSSTQGMREVKFSPNGRLLAVAGEDGIAIAWNLASMDNLGQLIQDGCTWLKPYLTNHPSEQNQLKICD